MSFLLHEFFANQLKFAEQSREREWRKYQGVASEKESVSKSFLLVSFFFVYIIIEKVQQKNSMEARQNSASIGSEDPFDISQFLNLSNNENQGSGYTDFAE